MDKDFVLSQFGKSKYLARREYRQFVLDGLPMGHQKKYYEVKDQRYLGEDEFIDQIERKKTSVDPAIFEINDAHVGGPAGGLSGRWRAGVPLEPVVRPYISNALH
ncbi:MAG: hypothetical protein QME78_09525 [Thermodesulfobacteriota bacterium]|nr:hypothetical protein [Thermodesulfobacteriota bacterium]